MKSKKKIKKKKWRKIDTLSGQTRICTQIKTYSNNINNVIEI